MTNSVSTLARTQRFLLIAQRRRLLIVAAMFAAVLGNAGCSLFQTGVPLKAATLAVDDSTKDDTTDATTSASSQTKTGSAADVMFQSTGGPFASPTDTPAKNVNVFGEVDGASAPAFTGGDAGGYQQRSFLDEGYDADPCVSPDGKSMVFASTRNNDHSDIYLQHVDGLAVTQLTADAADDAYPRFSRDSKQVAFASNRSGNWDVYVMDADGSHVRQVTRSAAQEIHPTFSPDGARIAYSALGARSGQWELWTLDLRTDERRMVGYGLFPDWSPRTDRDVIAFQRARQRGTRCFSAWTLDLIDGEPRNVTEVVYSSTAAIVAPTWNADGSQIAFCAISDPRAMPAEKSSVDKRKSRADLPRQDIWTIDANGANRVRVTDGQGVNASPAWSKNAELFFVSDRGGAEAIWSLKLERHENTTTAGAPD